MLKQYKQIDSDFFMQKKRIFVLFQINHILKSFQAQMNLNNYRLNINKLKNVK